MFQIRYTKQELPFEYPFRISKGSKTHQPTFVVELNYRGLCGYGEAPEISYYNISTDQMVADLENKRKFVENFNFTDPKRFWHFLHHLFPKNPFLVGALDMAGWDLYGKMRGKPLYDIFGFDMSKAPKTDYTIGIDSIDTMIEKLRNHPSPIYKIKVGTDNDLNNLFAIRKNTDAIIRIDANAGWTYEQGISYLPELERLEIECIEQPFGKDDLDSTRSFKKLTAISLIADESCVSQNDISVCADAFTGINIKLTKCSGITPALEMIKQARKSDLKIMLGCMNESTIGTAAIAHLAPAVDYLDADGPLLLKEDLASGLTYDDFTVIPSREPGLGITVNSDVF